jgi:hypothetical protein
VMAIPPYLDNIKFIDLNYKERNLFSHVNVGHLYMFAVEVEGGIADIGFDNVYNVNLNPNSSSLSIPSITLLSRSLSYGPAMGYIPSPTPLTDLELNTIITTQLAGVPFFNSTTFIPSSVSHHVHLDFDLSSFNKRRSPFQRFEYLQGKLNTFWVGALNSIDQTNVILDHTYRLIQHNFPSRNKQHQSHPQAPQQQAPQTQDYNPAPPQPQQPQQNDYQNYQSVQPVPQQQAPQTQDYNPAPPSHPQPAQQQEEMDEYY